jgi:hypothetical protein
VRIFSSPKNSFISFARNSARFHFSARMYWRKPNTSAMTVPRDPSTDNAKLHWSSTYAATFKPCSEVVEGVHAASTRAMNNDAGVRHFRVMDWPSARRLQ